MLKKLLSVFLSIISVFSFSVVANAQEPLNDNGEIQPYYEIINSNKSALVISNGQAVCEGRLAGHESVTKITMTMYLEKKSLLWWNTQQTWTGTFNSDRGVLSRTATVDSGTYRVRTDFVVYSGGNSESVTAYSSEVKC